jgi:beta-glucosidase
MPRRGGFFLGLAIATGLALTAGCRPQSAADACPAPSAGDSRPWLDASRSPACRAADVLATLTTLDAKLAFVDGGGFGASQGLEDIGLTTGRTQDGPAGFNGGTAWPTPLTLAASFDPGLAERFGVAMGREFHESGRNGVLGPAMDLTRTWHFGRSTESFGEDPYLAASIVAPEVAGIQSQHVLTTIKHYAVYTQEQGRLGDNPTGERPAVDQTVSERAIREIYLPPFRAAVERGGAGGVMCSFPRINGTYACEHAELLTQILKKEWGFDGAVFPDFPVAQRSIAKAFLAGLDAGVMSPNVRAGGSASSGRFAGEISLRDAVESGEVPESRIDDLVRRRLEPGFRVGTFDEPATAVRDEPSTEASRALAAEIVAAGAVLLKNDGTLPLGAAVRRIALIGPQAGAEAMVVEQGSAYVEPRHLVTALDGLRARGPGDLEIVYEAGGASLRALAAPPRELFTASAGEIGWRADYYTSPDVRLGGPVLASRTEPAIDVNGAPNVEGLPPDKQWAVRFSSRFTAAATGRHRFTLEGSGSAELWIGGELADTFYNADFGTLAYGGTDLAAGESIDIEVRYSPRTTLGDVERSQFATVLGTVLRLGYAPPDDSLARAVRAAAAADVAIVVAGHIVGEGMDRTRLALPGDQDALIAAVAEANPNTVVVLVTGGAVTMPWLARVKSVLEVWLPGDAFGTALAGLLYGDVEPSGRLPVTFPADESQGPGASEATYPGDRSPDGAVSTVRFDEGLAIGYRYWDAHEQTPLFPFGHGLSYASFSIEPLGATATPDGGAEVRARVANTSSRRGTEVVQVYVEFPAAAGEPPRQLKGFSKVTLDAGERRDVTIALAPSAFELWDSDSDRWTVPPGAFEVAIGRSSRDLVGRYSLTPEGEVKPP